MGFDSNALVLEISLQNNFLKMSLFEQKELASTLRHYSQCPVNLTEIGNFCREATAVLNKQDKKPKEDGSGCLLEKTGQLLWDNLLTKTIKDRLKNTLIRDLILYIDEELINIPWELLHDGQDFLCLKFNLGRLIITKVHAAAPQYRSSPAKLKMLILANPTDDLKSAYREGLEIKDQFSRRTGMLGIDFKSTVINRLYVKKNLRDYDIVHFAGHCEHEPDSPENSGWVLSDGRFTAQDIMLMGQTLSLPALIFSNACYSASLNTSLIESDYQKKTYAIASAFLFSGVRHYIGATRKIEDSSSRLFAREFYAQLVSGKTVGSSIRLARLKLVKEHGLAANLWASYILYGDPTFSLICVKPEVNRERTQKSGVPFYKKYLLRISLSAVFIIISTYLVLKSPVIHTGSYFLFKNTQKQFQQGKNQEVLVSVEKIIKNDPGFLSVYPLSADTYLRLGKKDQALKTYFTYALYSEKYRNKEHLASAYIGIGWIYQLLGEYPKAYEFYLQAMSVAKNNKDSLNEVRAMRKLAVWYMDNNDYDKALELLTKSSEINRLKQYLYEYKHNLACDYFDLGLVFANKNDYATARKFYTKSLELFKRLKLKNELSDCYFNRGETYLLEKEYHKALNDYLRGLSIDELQNNRSNIASDYNMIGELYLEMDDWLEAEKYFNQAVSLCRQINARTELAETYYNLGSLYKKKGRKNKAREYLRQAQEIYRSISHPNYEEIKKELLSFDT